MPRADASGKTNRSLAPRRGPEELADLVSGLTSQEKAEIIYELVIFAARAVAENDLDALRLFLTELEDMAEVYADPQKRRELERSLNDSERDLSPRGGPERR